MGTVTVDVGVCVEVESRIALQGNYDASTSKMRDILRTSNLIPLKDPYYTAPSATTPYSTAFVHVNGDGEKEITANVLDDKGSNSIVDWVFLELRDKTTNTLVKATRSALLQRDGDIVDIDGSSSVRFLANLDEYYLVVRHRNHLGVMTASPIDYTSLQQLPSSIDFTNPNTLVYTDNTLPTNANAPRKLLIPGVMGLWAGNASISSTNDAFRKVTYNGQANDRASVLTIVGDTTPLNVVPGYKKEDLNLDGLVKYNGLSNDRAIILDNVGSTTPTNIIYQHLPQ